MFGNGVSSAFVLTDDQQADGSIMLLQQTRASVEVEVCVEHPLVVQIEAQADFDRTYLWEIDKSVDRSEVTLDGAGSAEFHYVVAVTPQGFVDSDHSLTGSLTITNPNDHVEPVVTVEQSVSFEGLTCEVITADQDPDMPGVQVLVPAMVDGVDGTAVVEYGCSGEPDDYTGMVTASVAYQDANENDTVVTATNDVAYELDAEVNKTITVLDDKTDPTSDPVILGTADWNEEGIATEFDYTLRFDAVVGETVAYTNTAWIAETEQSDTETVKITADTPIVPITPPAKPVPPAKPTPKPLPPTGVEGSGWLLALGGSALLLGGGLVFGTNRRRQED